ncbi:hypothetical protein ACWDRB_47125 [Nonomuraea sp. NPDC003707]
MGNDAEDSGPLLPRGQISPVKLIVMHSTEAPEKPETAENVA